MFFAKVALLPGQEHFRSGRGVHPRDQQPQGRLGGGNNVLAGRGSHHGRILCREGIISNFIFIT